MLFGAIFRCLDPALTIAATLSYKSPFVSTALISFFFNIMGFFSQKIMISFTNELYFRYLHLTNEMKQTRKSWNLLWEIQTI